MPPIDDRMARPRRRGRPRKTELAQRPPPQPTRMSDHIVVAQRGIICPHCGRGADLRGVRRSVRVVDGAQILRGRCSSCAVMLVRTVTADSDTVAMA